MRETLTFKAKSVVTTEINGKDKITNGQKLDRESLGVPFEKSSKKVTDYFSLILTLLSVIDTHFKLNQFF